MENLISRYRNVTILVVVLFAQVLGLAVQVRRSTQDESTRLIRVWAVDAVTPLEKAIVWFQRGISNLWHNYFYLRGVRQENRDLKLQIERLRIEQVRLNEDAEQARRLQALLGFKEQFISKTLAAQVIGSSGSEQSRSIYIDKGTRDGIRPDMAVITAEGVVGKVLRAFKTTSQVLLINDQTSGVGSILEKSRLQGVLRGTPVGEVVLEKVMSDETVQPGEKVVTSGGDQIFPKGLPVGTVTRVSPGPELFLNIRVKPAADLSRLEEVLVITQQEEKQPALAEGTAPIRAADILAQRLPSVPDRPPDDPNKPPPPTSGLKILPAPTTQAAPGLTGSSRPSASASSPSSGQSRSGQGQLGPGQTSNTSVIPKPHADSAGSAGTPGSVSSATRQTGNPLAVKPPTAPKPAAPAVKLPEITNVAPDSQSQPGSPKPDAPSKQPATEPAPPQEQPQ
ncbi:MAG: rod shape-determining protein MreC [Terriglobales bacterium]